MQSRAALRYLLLLGARGSASGARHFSQRSTAPPSLNKAWLQLLKSYGMNHSACMMLTRDICRTIPKFRMKLHEM
jgi:hypothetical protein